jgi:hypothetical protein
MDKYAFETNRDRKGTEIVEACGRVVAANAIHCEPRAYHGVNRCRSRLRDKSFSLSIRTVDGCTLLKTRVEYMHEAFQRLIDWSIDEIGQDVCAAIKGPNGFCSNHRIKASRDFGWIESEDAISQTSVQL